MPQSSGYFGLGVTLGKSRKELGPLATLPPTVYISNKLSLSKEDSLFLFQFKLSGLSPRLCLVLDFVGMSLCVRVRVYVLKKKETVSHLIPSMPSSCS